MLASGVRINGSVTASPVVGGSGHWRQDRHLDALWLSGLQLACLPAATPPVWADSKSRSMTWTERRPARLFKKAAGAESSGDEFDERCIDTGVFQERYLLHELVFAWSQPLPRQPQISCTILTEADWCAVRTVARCEAGLLPVVGTVGAGARVIWWGRWWLDSVRVIPVCPDNRSCLSARWSVNPMPRKRRRNWTGDAFCRQDADHSFMLRARDRLSLGAGSKQRRARCRRRAVPAAFSSAGDDLRSLPLLAQPCLRGNLRCRADWRSLRGIAGCECAILPILEVVNN